MGGSTATWDIDVSCPPDHPWRNNKVSFNNKVETREAPVPLTGAQVLEQFESFEQVKFGKTTASKKGSATKTKDGTTGGRRVFFLSSLTGLLCSSGIIWTSCTLRKIYARAY